MQRGLVVIASASEPKHGYPLLLGAIAFKYGDGMVERVRQLAPKGVQAAFDLVGSGAVQYLIELTEEPSRVVSIVDFGALQFGAQMSTEPQQQPQLALAEAATMFEAGSFKMHVAETFPLAEVGMAQALSAEGRLPDALLSSCRAEVMARAGRHRLH